MSSGGDALFAAAILAVPMLFLAAGAAAILFALSDLGSPIEVTGPILRLRMFGDDDSRRYYVAVDDGTARKVRAWAVSPALYGTLEQGELVTVMTTKKLGCVRSIVPARGATPPPPTPAPRRLSSGL